ncbi:MAG: hypothetical protein ED554_04190 [Synechococcus sp. YX04-3]|nr:MAG: hypothetical protein ED554_04190 [Synechococcus sp. YX04-3]
MESVAFARFLRIGNMSNEQGGACMHMDLHALRLLHRIVSEAHANWPGGCPEEQQCLQTMKIQLYAALMDHLLEQ